MLKDLIAIAASFGIRLHAAHLPENVLGLYDHEASLIYFDLSLTPSEQRSVIAHELGHAYYGHEGESPVNERQADAFAAQLLVDPRDYAECEQINPDVHYIAEELSVTPTVIHNFRRYCLQKLGLRTYSRSRAAG